MTRGVAPVRKLNLKDGVKAFRKAGTRSGEASSDNDTLLYVFNFENNEGFALVSASKNTEGLMAIVEQGYCDPDTPSEIEGFEMFKDMAKEYHLEGRQEPQASSPILTPTARSLQCWDRPTSTMLTSALLTSAFFITKSLISFVT